MAKKKFETSKEILQMVKGFFPKFTDIFDEETFIIFFFAVTVLAIVGAIIAAKYFKITISDGNSQQKHKKF